MDNRPAIDLDRLQSQLLDKVASDRTYWAQNEAKFRAASQGVSYEQFQQLVKTCHLKPLDKKDKEAAATAAQPILNRLARKQ